MVESIEGNWAVGKAFDIHTVSSEYLGVDAGGRDRYDTKRSEMGQLVYELKSPEALGRTTQIWSIRIVDEDGRLVCISRFTVAVIPAKRA